jgi:hypothetical protein
MPMISVSAVWMISMIGISVCSWGIRLDLRNGRKLRVWDRGELRVRGPLGWWGVMIIIGLRRVATILRRRGRIRSRTFKILTVLRVWFRRRSGRWRSKSKREGVGTGISGSIIRFGWWLVGETRTVTYHEGWQELMDNWPDEGVQAAQVLCTPRAMV